MNATEFLVIDSGTLTILTYDMTAARIEDWTLTSYQTNISAQQISADDSRFAIGFNNSIGFGSGKI